MTVDYSHFKPLLLETISVEVLKSPQYRRFIIDATIVPGIRLLLARHKKRPDWPYVDTKFNPNFGTDLPESSYNVIHTWMIGRGAEALAGHLEWLDRLESLTPAEKRETREVFAQWIGNHARDLCRIFDKHAGRCPFRVNRDFDAIDENGRVTAVDTEMTGAGDLFGAKGIIAEGSEANVQRGVDLLLRSAGYIRQNRFGADQFKEQPKDVSHGMRMLMQLAVSLTYHKTRDARIRARILDLGAEFIAYILDKHYNADTAVFSEYIDRDTGQRKDPLDPGHANEFVGLGLGAAACMQADKATLTPARQHLLDRVYREMPRLLIQATRLGWNRRYPGLYKLVNNRTGEPLNDDMPWWNLPETLRAGVWAYKVAGDEKVRQQCLELVRLCHNAYFTNYPNPSNMLFPYQTISGATGQVVDKVPAVPEGDPLYHTNLALLEMLEVIETL